MCVFVCVCVCVGGWVSGLGVCVCVRDVLAMCEGVRGGGSEGNKYMILKLIEIIYQRISKSTSDNISVNRQLVNYLSDFIYLCHIFILHIK